MRFGIILLLLLGLGCSNGASVSDKAPAIENEGYSSEKSQSEQGKSSDQANSISVPNAETEYLQLEGYIASNHNNSVLKRLVETLPRDSSVSVELEYGKEFGHDFVSYQENKAISGKGLIVNYLHITEHQSKSWNPDAHFYEFTFETEILARQAATQIKGLISDGSLMNDKPPQFIAHQKEKVIYANTRAFAFIDMTQGYLDRIVALSSGN
jgi:hypothetical protein